MVSTAGLLQATRPAQRGDGLVQFYAVALSSSPNIACYEVAQMTQAEGGDPVIIFHDYI